MKILTQAVNKKLSDVCGSKVYKIIKPKVNLNDDENFLNKVSLAIVKNDEVLFAFKGKMYQFIKASDEEFQYNIFNEEEFIERYNQEFIDYCRENPHDEFKIGELYDDFIPMDCEDGGYIEEIEKGTSLRDILNDIIPEKDLPKRENENKINPISNNVPLNMF